MVNMLSKKSPLEKKNNYDAKKNGRIRHIKDRTKEQEVVVAYTRNPGWPRVIKQREKEHVNYLAVKPRSRRIGWVILKKHPVESTIDNITHCSAKDQGHAPKKPGMRIFFGHLQQI